MRPFRSRHRRDSTWLEERIESTADSHGGTRLDGRLVSRRALVQQIRIRRLERRGATPTSETHVPVVSMLDEPLRGDGFVFLLTRSFSNVAIHAQLSGDSHAPLQSLVPLCGA